ncbi:hypothetical protein JHK85_032354 [Glycine max]|uniref:Uncharacterized protein n=1 Tax=Glycine max TaxID=3847 RepID=K7LQT3_SOYBN|nr:protein MODIFIED TRANSPORT TO THE VACUOLE 1 isoform X1 [Glycine max]KAG4989371.1 hypothetical protein JHK85_032354 [Glycine max]KAH1159873.1 hypothetical protein GYH30_031572 [Glycine max]|eukprot:XP_025980226.1 protein MODIFIED TRANSPORT TO THE VACUOLE 1 isoform X1 [Glycine max]
MVGPNFMDEIDCGSFFDHIDDLLDFPVKDVDGGAATLPSVAANIVKELSDFILKRLDHKSPIVKHKTLRLIKYAVGKCGVEFRREMQRHSVAIRQLLHYKGQSDPVKGDAFNKAMRDTAQEAISAIFSADDTNKQPLPAPAAAAGLNRRIEGFGNTNFQAPSQDNKKSFLGEVVDIGNATTKQGLSAFTQGHSSLIKNEAGTGTYKGPNNLPASFMTATESGDRYEPFTEPSHIMISPTHCSFHSHGVHYYHIMVLWHPNQRRVWLAQYK